MLENNIFRFWLINGMNKLMIAVLFMLLIVLSGKTLKLFSKQKIGLYSDGKLAKSKLLELLII